MPVYQGGAEYSLIRQSKETLEQQRLAMEQVRDQARADLVTAWGQLVAGKAQVTAAQSQVEASEIAYLGTTKEAQVGQRTVIDILNAQQTLVNARVALVTARTRPRRCFLCGPERDRTPVAAGAAAFGADL